MLAPLVSDCVSLLHSLSVQSHPVKEVAYRPASYVTHDTPGQDTGLLNLISDWFH